MDIIECIKTRQETRAFRNDSVSETLINELLEIAVQAPSAGNTQDWEFIVVRQQKTKETLAQAAHGQDFIAQAAVIIIVCSNMERIQETYGTRGLELYSIQDTAAASQNLLLASHSKGLGTCWVGSFDEKEVQNVLELPDHILPMALIPIGYPAAKTKKPDRRPLNQFVHFEKFNPHLT